MPESLNPVPPVPEPPTQATKGGSVRASELLKCPRLLSFHFHGYPPSDAQPVEPSLDEPRRLGLAAEAEVIRALEADGFSPQTALRIQAVITGVQVNGVIDVLLESLGMVIEVKATRCSRLPQEPEPTHAAQAEFYRQAGGWPRAVVVYVAYDAPRQVRAFEVYDPMLRALMEINLSRARQEPWKLQRIKQHACAYCRYRTLCWEGTHAPAKR